MKQYLLPLPRREGTNESNGFGTIFHRNPLLGRDNNNQPSRGKQLRVQSFAQKD